MANRNVFTLSQVSKHKSKNDNRLVIDGRVINVTKFLQEHPGGEEVLLEVAGKDATKEFQAVGHSKAAQNLLIKYQVGALEGYAFQETDDGKQAPATFKETKKEMSDFVVKDDAIQKFAPLLELFVPLVVAGSYFCYRYITAVNQARISAYPYYFGENFNPKIIVLDCTRATKEINLHAVKTFKDNSMKS